ncbi:MAG: tetratricopeptide repeat protein [Gammaproteobacteria bacterium]|nr:tetratricopeptide repeat protein [Gammaproteobacteria bacterium]
MGSRFSSLLPLLVCTLLTACGSPEERSANYLEKAEALFAQEDYVTARIEAQNAAQIEPRNADVRYLLAQIEETEQNFRKSIGHLQVAVDADPNHLKSRLKLGNYYILAKATELATEQAEAAIKLAPDNAEAMLLQSRIHYLNEDIETAMKEVDAALTNDPTLIDALTFKAGLIIANGETDAALQLIQSGINTANPDDVKKLRQFRVLILVSAERHDAIETDLKTLAADYPDDESFPLALAQLYVSQKRLDEAEVIYRSYIDQDSQDVQRRLAFVRFMGAQHGPEAAESELKGFVADLPETLELHLALGQLYESLEKQDEALATYEQIGTTEPKSTVGLAARNRIAIIRIQQNDPDEAKAVIAAILNDEQDNSDALMVRAAFSYTEKRFDDTITDLRTILRTLPDSERALLLLARSHSAGNSLELAQDAYRRLIELNPEHPVASAELAELLAQSGDVPKAEEVLREQLATTPEDRRAASSLIQALLLQGDVEAAETEARTMLDLGDDTGLAEFQLGRVLQAKQSSQQAVAAYRAALEKNPEAPEPLQGLIAILTSEGQPEKAVTFLLAHLDQYPTQLPPRILLAAVYAQQGKIESAAELFEETISLQPKATRAYAALATLYPNDPARRLDIYKRGVNANPQDVISNMLLAGEYERNNQFEDAIKIYENLLVKDRNDVLAANNLAALLLDYRSDPADHARALDLAKQFEISDQAALLDTLGWAYYRNGDYINATRILEKAVAGNDKVGLLHYHLGMALLKANRPEEGRSALEQALSLAENDFPGIEEARAVLKQL